LAAFIQAIATIILVVVTSRYVRKTHLIAKASGETAEATRELAKSTEESAKATGELAALTRDMMIANACPRVVLKNCTASSPGHPNRFVGLVNVGFGPALDVVYKIPVDERAKPVASDVEMLMKENTGHTLGITPDNIVVLSAMHLPFDKVSFTVEYGDVYGNLYRTIRLAGNRTTTKKIQDRILSE
jgi:hypothetical protein